MAAKKNANSELTTASVLAFERKLDPSDGVLSAGKWEDRGNSAAWPTVPVREKAVRGTISNRLKAGESDPGKLDAKIQSPNLQKVDVATLPMEADTLRVHFSLRVLAGAGTPSACNGAAYRSRLLASVASYVNGLGFGELSRRYAANLANGRFLWRNRIGAEMAEVVVRRIEDGRVTQSWTFDALKLNLRELDALGDQADAVESLGKVIAAGLEGTARVLLEVVAHVRVGEGQEVFPSQELILDRGAEKKGQKSKTLYAVGEAAAMHSQKIGNALRTIDTWYPECSELGPIAVEPYGSVTSQGKAYRQPKDKVDFYSLLDGWVLRDQQLRDNEQHFVIANLIRGGVFGEAEKE